LINSPSVQPYIQTQTAISQPGADIKSCLAEIAKLPLQDRYIWMIRCPPCCARAAEKPPARAGQPGDGAVFSTAATAPPLAALIGRTPKSFNAASSEDEKMESQS
jgi:hypothetical protein